MLSKPFTASMDLKDVLTSARPSEKEMFEDESDDSEGELCTTPEGKKSEKMSSMNRKRQ